MDDTQQREFRWYILGCLKLEQEPTLGYHAFRTLYDRYQRYSRTIQRYEAHKKRRIARRRGSNYQDDAFLERLMRSIRQEQEELDHLAAAVATGQAIDNGNRGAGGAGVPAYRSPEPPVLVGAGAKLLPHMDPEPWMRDP